MSCVTEVTSAASRTCCGKDVAVTDTLPLSPRYARIMPLYDFRCPSCRHSFEELVKLDQTPRCPACGAENPERVKTFSAAVSTEGTRQRALAGARQKASATK